MPGAPTTLQAAVNLLRAAGYTVTPPPSKQPARTADKKAEQAAGVRYGCHIDVERGEPVCVGCVLDYGVPGDCRLALTRRVRETCVYWRRWDNAERAPVATLLSAPPVMP